ncbi:ESPR-type extended signal peptide-containing protein [Paraburkholderia hayleyella]|uniref:ESPR-type extended signal peptide-containing protein n=1 Tax=Paraburkholderia hayleyella TaxID=2152889 RepID=UPI001290CD93|nr:ESPR-type extended signal peptide-containing protein [Paraburkholderia hayleyella]
MNKVYRVIRNKKTGMWMVAPESAKGRAKSRARSTVQLSALVAVMGFSLPAMADKTDPFIGAEGPTGNYCYNGGKIATCLTWGTGFSDVAGKTFAYMTPSDTTLKGGVWAGDISSGLFYGAGPSGMNRVLVTSTGTTISGTDVTLNSTNGVSVASKKITSLAAGTADTDAVNVSQLKSITTALGGGAVVAADGTITAPSYVVQGGTVNNVGAALSSLNTAANTNAGNISTQTGRIDTINNGGSRYFKTVGKNDGTDDAKVSGTNSVALGANSVADRDNTISVGRTEIKDGTGAVTQSGITRQITNVADGTQTKDAVNKGQLDTVNTTLTAAVTTAQTTADETKAKLNTLDGLAVKYDSTSKDKVTLGGAGTTGTVTLGNVKAGTADTDAVNKGQLDAVNTALNAAVTTAQTTADEAKAKSSALDGLAVKYDSTSKDKVTLGGAGTTGTVALGNVKAGIASNDAVNVGQLKPMVDALGGGAKLDAQTGAVSGPSYAIQGGTFTTVGDALGKLDTATTKNTGDITKNTGDITNLTSTVNNLNAGTTGLVQQDATSKAITVASSTGGTTVNIAGTAGDRQLKGMAAGTADTDGVNLKQLKGMGLTTDTAGNVTNAFVAYDSTSKDKVTLGGAGTTGTVALGNVKAGIASNDAVNVGQLKPMVEALGGGAKLDAQTGAVSGPSYAIQGGTFTTVGEALGKLDTATTKNTGDITKNTGDITNLTSTVNNLNAGTTGLVQQDATTKAITVASGTAGTTVNIAGTAGERQLKGMAAGTADTDGVNLKQLKGMGLTTDTAGNVTNAFVAYDSTSKDKVTLGGAGTTGTVALGNVKAGIASNDAVNVGQLKPMVEALGGGAKLDAQTGAVSGPSYAIQSGTFTTVGDALGKLDTATTKNTGDITKNTGDITNLTSTVNNLNAGTTGLVQQDATTKAITVASGTAGTTVNIAGTAGERQLKGMAAGTADTDGINLKQLKGMGLTTDTAGNVTNAFVAYDSTSKDKVTLGGAGTTGTVALGNVKAGIASNDAVNVGQLKPMVEALGGGAKLDAQTGAVSGPSYAIQGGTFTTVGDALGKLDTATTKNTGDITNLTSTVNNINAGTTGLVQQDATSKAITVASSTGGTTVNIAGTAGERQLKGMAAGTADTDGINLKQLKGMGLTTDTAGNVTNAFVAYDSTSKDKVTLGGAGTTGTVALGNVKAGIASNDAVNVGQLKPMVDALGGGAKLDAQTGAVSGPSYAIQSGTFTTVGDALGKLDTATTKNTGDITKNTGDITNLTSTVNSITGGMSKYTAFNSTGTAASASGADAVALGMGTLASGKNSVALGANSVADRDNTISVGRAEIKDGTGTVTQTEITRQITNVADGTQAKDAVNKGQLDTVQTAAATAQKAADAAKSGFDTLDGLAVKYDSTSKDKVTLGGAGTTGTVALGNVKAGIASNDAVNVGQLKPMVEALGGGAKLDAQTGAVSGPSYAIQSGTYTTVGDALGKLDTATTKNTGDITNLTSTVNNINAGTTGLVQQDATSKAITVASSTGGTTVNIAGTAGERQLKGMAAGTADTDGINLKQLKGMGLTTDTAGNVTNAFVAYDSTSKDKVTLGGTGTTGTVALGNVKSGITSNDAVNVAQLKPMVDALGGGAKLDAKTGAVSGPSYAIQGGTFTTVGDALGKLDTATTKNTGDITKNTGDITNLASTVNNINAGTTGLVQQDATSKTVTVAKNLAGTIVDFTGTAGARQLRGVAAGTVSATSTDGINGAQLHAVATSVAGALGGGAAVNNDGSVTMPKYTVGGSTVSGVGGAITKLDDRLTENSTSINQITNSINNGGLGLVTQDKTNGNILVASAMGGKQVNVAGTDGPRVVTGLANGKDDRDAVSIAQLKAVGLMDPNGRAMGAVVYDDLSLGRATLGGTNGTVLGNVANGLIASGSREAVNGSQLYAVQQQYDKLNGRVDDLNTRVENNKTNGGGTDGKDGNDTSDNGLIKHGAGAGSMVVDPTAHATGEKGIAMGSNASAAGEQSLAMGADASAPANRSLAMGQGSVADRDNTVSIGSKGNERQITNVAAGSAPTDAVNVGQLNKGLTSLNQTVSSVARSAYSGVAAAMAMPNMTPSGPGRTIVAAGAANYKSGAAAAASVTYRSLNNHWLMNGAVSLTSTGDTGVRAQVGYEF